MSHQSSGGLSHEVEVSAVPTAGPRDGTQWLKSGSIGIVAVAFMALANAAPITAMTGNVPIAIGYGNGKGAPAGYAIATVVLVFFAIGYSAMARHITATGAFYGFISHGLGQVLGMASGLLATMAYVVFEGSLVGIFASFARGLVVQLHGPTISWIWFALVCIAIVAVLGYYDIEISGRILILFLVTEVAILVVFDVVTFFKGFGSQGFVASTLNPLNALKPAPSDAKLGIVGSAGIGLFFAFWSWIGFETTAVYGEESRDPKKVIPRATMIVVVFLGVIYTFSSWAGVASNGIDKAIAVSRGSTGNSFDVYFQPIHHLFGGFGQDLYQILTVTGSFACALAFHNAASRYVYALGREGGSDFVMKTLGATHGKHKSPHIASIVQTVITLALTLYFFWGQKPTTAAPDVAYFYLYSLLAVLGTLAVLIVQVITSIAVIWYFHVGKNHPETANWWRTFLAPLIGTVGMSYVVWVLVTKLSFAAGAGADSPVYKATPYIVIVTFLIGLIYALVLRSVKPDRYAQIGRTVLEEARERE